MRHVAAHCRAGDNALAAALRRCFDARPITSLPGAVSNRSITLVLGGARSGKSAHAESLFDGRPSAVYIATAEIFDEEMRERIDLHRARRGEQWRTVEAPLDLAGALDTHAHEPVLVDCLTVWMGNLMHAERDLDTESERLVECVARRPGPLVLVASEVGLGIVPENAMARRFRDAAGRLNQRIAAAATRVVLVAAGLPLVLKGD